MNDKELAAFDFTKVDVKGILPQREPYLMVSRLLSYSNEKTVVEYVVADDCVFCEDGRLQGEGLVEVVAQACAARIGFISRYILHRPVNIGYVCALKDFRIFRTPASGERLVTTIEVKADYGSMQMVFAQVGSPAGEVAEGTMSIALDEDRTVPGQDRCVVKVADNIISPLGTSTRENYRRVKAGESALSRREATEGLPEAYFASLIDDSTLEREYASRGIGSGYTRFERRIILSVSKALEGTGVDPAGPDVLFIISSTKGNVELLDGVRAGSVPPGERLGVSAGKIAGFFGNRNTPVVVSNACISGLSAQIAAMRQIRSGRYSTVIVSGSDVQSRFIISGFQSFKALSDEACRPFDKDRRGLNLGEAAATIIFKDEVPGPDDWCIVSGAVRNDANHISGPSRTGEGSFRALKAALGDFDPGLLAMVSVHGTSTPYNDEMEAIAIARAGLDKVPVSCLKGVFGHTMGAAGILETILSMASVDDGTVLGTRGYSECGVSRPLMVTSENVRTDRKSFMKLLSGFGGCNAAALFVKGGGR